MGLGNSFHNKGEETGLKFKLGLCLTREVCGLSFWQPHPLGHQKLPRHIPPKLRYCQTEIHDGHHDGWTQAPSVWSTTTQACIWFITQTSPCNRSEKFLVAALGRNEENGKEKTSELLLPIQGSLPIKLILSELTTQTASGSFYKLESNSATNLDRQ